MCAQRAVVLSVLFQKPSSPDPRAPPDLVAPKDPLVCTTEQTFLSSSPSFSGGALGLLALFQHREVALMRVFFLNTGERGAQGYQGETVI